MRDTNKKTKETDTIVKFTNANIENGEAIVIYGLDLEVRPSDFIYIVGKVGTGKTSIIRTITAENQLNSGEGMVCGYNLRKIKNKEIPLLRRKMGVIFQDYKLLMDRSIGDNLEFVLRATGWKDRDAIDKRIEETLKAVGLETKAHKMPHQLSGGEQQRAAIARALLNKPEIILADEPTGNLDEETADGIMKLLRHINKEQHTAVIMVTHNSEIYRKYQGRIMECKNETCKERPSSENNDTTKDCKNRE